MRKEILKFGLEKGFLLDEEVLKLLSEIDDFEAVKLIIEKIRGSTEKKIITKDVFQDKDKVNQVFSVLPEKARQRFEKLKIKFGLKIEISKEIITSSENRHDGELINNLDSGRVKIVSMPLTIGKKIEVQDFVTYFRNRFVELRKFLIESPYLENLVSINKISGDRQGISIIGMVSGKRVTKNKNLLFEVEDLTGRIKVVINKNRQEIYDKAEEIALDSIVGFKGSGNKEIVFANDVVFPEARLSERKKSNVEECVAFISDLQYGSKLFIHDAFERFIDYLNANTEESRKIKYLFIVGDLVSGIGVYPGQEKDLEIHKIEDQYINFAKLLSKIRKDITIIISPGNHDGVRLMEPQPLFDEKYAWPLYDLKNVIITGNPAYVNIGARNDFSGFNILTYHGFSYPYYANVIPSLIANKAINSPELIMKYLLKNRHLAPSHASTQYFPLEEDGLLIKNIPDIFVSGHLHKSAITYHNNILLISGSSWEWETGNQKKRGNTPDFCKVPLFNLKTREVKILDFEKGLKSEDEI